MNNGHREMARQAFAMYGQEFAPVVVLDNEQFFIMDWKDRNGSGNLAIRYIVDRKKGDLIIKGDAGECIASWYNEVSPENLAKYMNSTGYFIEKIRVTSDKYSYSYRDIEEDLEDQKRVVLELMENGDLHTDFLCDDDGLDEEELLEERRGEIDEDFGRMANILHGLYLEEGCTLPEELTELYEKYSGGYPWHEAGFGDIGERVSERVYLWIYGFQTGMEQLAGRTLCKRYD